MDDFGLTEPQTPDDLRHLLGLAKELDVRHVVYSAAKLTQPRGRKLSGTMRAMRDFYGACAAPEKLDFHGGSWRLPRDVAQTLIEKPFLDPVPATWRPCQVLQAEPDGDALIPSQRGRGVHSSR